MELADFLLARIAEDEAVAVQLGELLDMVTVADRSKLDAGVREGMGSIFAVADGAPADGAPGRLLAECDAKRRIVEDWRRWRAKEGMGGDQRTVGLREGLELALKLLALPYVEHPDYRGQWRT
jgi:hypothetical protein